MDGTAGGASSSLYSSLGTADREPHRPSGGGGHTYDVIDLGPAPPPAGAAAQDGYAALATSNAAQQEGRVAREQARAARLSQQPGHVEVATPRPPQQQQQRQRLASVYAGFDESGA